MSALGLLLIAARPALAGEDEPPVTAEDRRTVPNYDGRPEPGPSFGEIVSWAPRVVLFPVYLVSEYVVRRPLGWLVTNVERSGLPEILRDVFIFDEEGKVGLVPTLFIEFGFRSSFGLFFFWDDLIANGNDLRIHVASGGRDWLLATAKDRVTFSGSRIEVKGGFLRRPDYIFSGIGSMTEREMRSRYGADRVDATAAFQVPIWHAGDLEVFAGYRLVRFFDVVHGDDPSLRTAVAAGFFPGPPGLEENHQLYRHGAILALDTRQPWPLPGSGLRLELSVENAFDLEGGTDSGYVKYGGTAGGVLDLTGDNRNVSLSLGVEMTDPISGDGEVPFTELSTLTSRPGMDGFARMPGFLPGELIGRSVASAVLAYRWPVWSLMDGSIHAGLGNAFGRHLSGFELDRLRLSLGMGFSSIGPRDSSLVIQAAVGTDPFEEGFQFDSFHFEIGTQRGF